MARVYARRRVQTARAVLYRRGMKRNDADPARRDNEWLSEQLEEVAVRLEDHDANPFRVRAWRSAAGTLRELDRPASEIFAERDLEGLRALPTIGGSLARAIAELVTTGKLGLLERLRGEDHADIFTTVPGIGPQLARRIHERLHIDDLQDLEAAAYDGSLSDVPGMGPGRVRAVRESLAYRTARRTPAPATERRLRALDEPPVEELLDVDREYRAEAEHGRLPRIAPRRFNPAREAWLPVLHTERGERHYTALYSNTARAHGLGTTHDWVVIYRDDHDGHGQWTVITAHFGKMKGARIVRGREAECHDHYEARRAAQSRGSSRMSPVSSS
jgi:hypothetical protein